MKGNSPFHIAARLNGSLGNFLKEFVDLYTAKVFIRSTTESLSLLSAFVFKDHDHKPVRDSERMIQAKAHFQELLMKNEQDQNPFHIACKSGEIKSGMTVSMIIVEIDFNFMCRELGDGGVSLTERCRCS